MCRGSARKLQTVRKFSSLALTTSPFSGRGLFHTQPRADLRLAANIHVHKYGAGRKYSGSNATDDSPRRDTDRKQINQKYDRCI